MHYIIYLLVFCFLLLCEAKPPQLTPLDAHLKIEEILKAHVSHNHLSTGLIARSFQNFIEELDPSKTYFIQNDLQPWLSPSEEFLTTTLNQYLNKNFSEFEKIYAVMIQAIERRNVLEKTLEKEVLPEKVHARDFKDLPYAENLEALKERMIKMKALQLETARQLSPENPEQFLQKIQKRRWNREAEIRADSHEEKERCILAYVLKAVSSALDSQTLYFTPAEAAQFMMQVQQKLFGIGAQLRDDLSGFTIVRLVEGGPASQPNKLKEGDRIVAVNQEPIVGMDIVEAVELIRGPLGSPVRLTILREVSDEEDIREEKLEIELFRGEVVLKETRLETSYHPYGDGVIVVLHLFSFYQDATSSSADDIFKALNQVQKEHKVYGVILDLRSNGGGVLPQAVAVTGLFIEKGIVVSVKDNTGFVHHLRNLDQDQIWKGPLCVLTNRLSASAAEIVAQTLQDYGRALVIGDPETFGKGTFQTFTLETSHFGKVNPKGEFKVTRGRYYTVSGKSPQLVGVKADIVVPSALLEMEVGEKHAKFPVSSDAIDPNFEDNLADVPAMQRFHIKKLYKNKQKIQKDLPRSLIYRLQENSIERISHDKNYQNFLLKLSSLDERVASETFGETDLQLNETLNIMKDLIFFERKGSALSK